MNDTIVTIRGWVGGAPRYFPPDENGAGAATIVNVGVTPRYFSRAHSEFRKGVTTWYSVRCYGSLAKNAATSLHKGTPVLVRGRLTQRMWADRDGVARTSLVIHADSVGVEISTGMANFVKIMNTPPAAPGDEQWRVEPKAESSEAAEAGQALPEGRGEDSLDVVDIEAAALDAEALGADVDAELEDLEDAQEVDLMA
ncbi:single-stranded DNA-binding protein [Trueperella sp.]|uniref:single-stranded DNA-binding protein n=1 Tax=Trueperella sp. TaxID=2699835 RepID=UPI0022EA0FEB|nr:single-stranded DNA-binding protein [Trueperella sp.]